MKEIDGQAYRCIDEMLVYHAWGTVRSIVDATDSLVKSRHCYTHFRDSLRRRVTHAAVTYTRFSDRLALCKLSDFQMVGLRGVQPTNLKVAGFPVVAEVQRFRWCECHIKEKLNRRIPCSECARP